MQALTLARAETSGDYRLDASAPADLTVADGARVRFFEDAAAPAARTVSLGSGASCEWYVLATSPADWSLTSSQEGEGSRLSVRLLLAARAGGELKARVLARVGGDRNRADVKALSLAGTGARVNLDATAHVLPGAHKAEGYVHQENVFLDETGTVRGVPGLRVESDDVQAGHSARTQRLDDARVFYLRSRGIPKDDARAMMLRDAAHALLADLDEAAREELTGRALGFALGATRG